jgi:hypothetical protein
VTAITRVGDAHTSCVMRKKEKRGGYNTLRWGFRDALKVLRHRDAKHYWLCLRSQHSGNGKLRMKAG